MRKNADTHSTVGLLFDVKQGLRKARPFFPRGREVRDDDNTLGLIAETVVEHLRLCRWQLNRRLPHPNAAEAPQPANTRGVGPNRARRRSDRDRIRQRRQRLPHAPIPTCGGPRSLEWGWRPAGRVISRSCCVSGRYASVGRGSIPRWAIPRNWAGEMDRGRSEVKDGGVGAAPRGLPGSAVGRAQDVAGPVFTSGAPT